MKKRMLLILISSILLFPFCVHASMKCVYTWPNYPGVGKWEISLSGLNENNVFTEIASSPNAESAGLDFVGDISLNADGTCPTISFYHGYFAGDKIYQSYDKCLEKLLDGGCVQIDADTIRTEDNDKTNFNTAGTPQAVLVNSPDAKTCRYEHTFDNGGNESKVTIYIKNEDDHISARCENNTIGIGACGVTGIGNIDLTPGEDFTCPSYIYFNYQTDNGVSYCILQGQGGSQDENISGVTPPENQTPDIGFEVGELNCDNIFQGRFGAILKEIMDLLKFAVPIIIIALSVVDYIKALVAQNQEEIKKASQRFMKRLIIGVLIFVLPTIIEFLLGLAGIQFGVCALG